MSNSPSCNDDTGFQTLGIAGVQDIILTNEYFVSDILNSMMLCIYEVVIVSQVMCSLSIEDNLSQHNQGEVKPDIERD